MRITRLVKRIGRTVTNRETFQSTKVEEEVEAIINEGDSIEEADKALFEQVTKMMEADYERIKEKRTKKDK